MNDESTNNKLLVLFILEKFEMPIAEELFLSLCCVDNTWMPYLYCKQVINELTTSAFISKTNVSGLNSPLLSITTDGRNCLAYFYKDIPLSLQNEIKDFLKENRLSYRKRQEFTADYFHNEDGTFTVSLKIQDMTKTIVDLKMIVESRTLAISVKNNWNTKAPELYKLLHDILIEN
ncbi:MAG: DUF4364 family protein [Clostridia bacterium]|nr:DUF4364 family protein [Clostridia bacterium]